MSSVGVLSENTQETGDDVVLEKINISQYTLDRGVFNPIGPRILIKHAFLFPGFLANFEQFYLLAFNFF